MYDNGYAFTRLGRGVMVQTRSVRIDLAKFSLTSENRRILKKNERLKSEAVPLPLKNPEPTTPNVADGVVEPMPTLPEK